MDVLTSETRWALNNEIIKQVTSCWSIFIELSRWCTFNKYNMFRMLTHPSSGACELFVELFMGCIALVRCVLVLLCGLAGVVWYPDSGWSTTPTRIVPEQYNLWNNSKISRKLLKMDVLTSETCWAFNNEIKKQVTSSWSIFIQQTMKYFGQRAVGWYCPLPWQARIAFLFVVMSESGRTRRYKYRVSYFRLKWGKWYRYTLPRII